MGKNLEKVHINSPSSTGDVGLGSSFFKPPGYIVLTSLPIAKCKTPATVKINVIIVDPVPSSREAATFSLESAYIYYTHTYIHVCMITYLKYVYGLNQALSIEIGEDLDSSVLFCKS